MMKTFTSLLGAAVAAVALSTLPLEADARRLGGGKSAGMQRQTPPPRAADATPATPAQPGQAAAVAPKQAAAPAAAGAAAAAGKRSWLGPIAGIAAGLGIAALMSHLGMGEAFGNMLTLLLLAVVAFVAIRWLMGRMRGGAAARPVGPQLAGAGAPVNGWAQAERPAEAPSAPMQRQAMGQEPVASAAVGSAGPVDTSALPGFDAAGFERIAKMIFVRLQAANDSADVEDLRKFTTPELFASLRLDLQDRGDAKQQTDVVQLNAQVVETAQEADQQIVSVRFDGLIREEIGGAAAPFDEVWHLVRPADGSREWAIAGIAPIA